MNHPVELNQVASNAIEYIQAQAAKSTVANAIGAHSPVAQIVNETLKQLIAVKPAYKNSLNGKGAVAEWKRSWTLAFAQHGINSIHQIELGIKRARCDTSPFMPSVGQFIEWCNPAALSDEQIIDAFTRMIEHKKALNDIEHATRLKCGFQCKTYLKHDKAIALFSYHMKIYAAKAARGEHIPSMNTPLLENKAPSARDYFEQQMQQRQPKTHIEARLQRLRLQQRSAK